MMPKRVHCGAALAITLHQPWASLIACGLKDVENRRWMPPPSVCGGPLFIHAGQRWDEAGFQWAKQLTGGRLPGINAAAYRRGAVLGRVRLIDGHGSHACHRGSYADLHPEGPYRCSLWAMGGGGPMCHWVLADAVALPEPVACRGLQRLWRLPDEVAEQVTSQLTESAGGA